MAGEEQGLLTVDIAAKYTLPCPVAHWGPKPTRALLPRRVAWSCRHPPEPRGSFQCSHPVSRGRHFLTYPEKLPLVSISDTGRNRTFSHRGSGKEWKELGRKHWRTVLEDGYPQMNHRAWRACMSIPDILKASWTEVRRMGHPVGVGTQKESHTPKAGWSWTKPRALSHSGPSSLVTLTSQSRFLRIPPLTLYRA